MTLDNKYRRIFTGWMFASSPGLHAIEHPIYDVWLVDCKGGSDVIAEAKEQEDVPAVAAKPEKAKRAGQGRHQDRPADQRRRPGGRGSAARRAGPAAPEAVAQVLPVERRPGAGSAASAAAAAEPVRRAVPLSDPPERSGAAPHPRSSSARQAAAVIPAAGTGSALRAWRLSVVAGAQRLQNLRAPAPSRRRARRASRRPDRGPRRAAACRRGAAVPRRRTARGGR